MAGNTEMDDGRRGAHLRMAAWGAAALLLLTPLIAMQFTDEVQWSPGDFVVFGVMLLAALGAYELAFRLTHGTIHRAAIAAAIGTGFLLVWVNLAVGFIGDESNAANLMYGGVLMLAILSAIVTRLQPGAMAVVMVATAGAQILVAVIAALAGMAPSMVELVLATGLFVVLWLIPAGLFMKAARQR
jgi:hypothetical protein